jgi:hypothetical protein
LAAARTLRVATTCYISCGTTCLQLLVVALVPLALPAGVCGSGRWAAGVSTLRTAVISRGCPKSMRGIGKACLAAAYTYSAVDNRLYPVVVVVAAAAVVVVAAAAPAVVAAVVVLVVVVVVVVVVVAVVVVVVVVAVVVVVMVAVVAVDVLFWKRRSWCWLRRR